MSWRERAECQRYNADLWFPDEDTPPESVAAAVSICSVCPVRGLCAGLPAEYGIFGGQVRKLGECEA